MGRIDLRNLDDETLDKIDAQCKKYGISTRVDYVKLVINLDLLTNIVEIIKDKKEK